MKGDHPEPIFEGAHEGRRTVQAGAEAAAGPIPRQGSCCSRQNRAAERASISESGGRRGNLEAAVMALPEPAGEQFYTDCRYQEGASATTQGGVVTESGNVTGWPVPAICRGKQDAAPANSQPPKSIAGIFKEKRVSPYRFNDRRFARRICVAYRGPSTCPREWLAGLGHLPWQCPGGIPRPARGRPCSARCRTG